MGIKEIMDIIWDLPWYKVLIISIIDDFVLLTKLWPLWAALACLIIILIILNKRYFSGN